jgi:hypothetical protein
MSCCDESTARVPNTDVNRRAVLKGAALIAAVIPAAQPAGAQGKKIKLATKSLARPARSRTMASMLSWSIRAAAAPPCRR